MLNVALIYLLDYKDIQSDWFDQLDYIIIITFLGVYGVKLYVSQHRLQYLFSIQSILFLFIILPILSTPDPDPKLTSFYFVTFSRYVRSIFFCQILAKYYKLGQTDVDRQINIVLMTMILLMYVSCGLYQQVENTARPNDPMKFHDSLYFVVVTLFTVGYGDYYPSTIFGRIIVMFIIIFTIILIPQQTNELLRLMNLQSRYRRTAYKSVEVKHILVTGSLGLQALKNFCDELFHEDHGSQATNAVILQQDDPKPEMELFIQKYGMFLTYLAGNPLNSRDLMRGDTHKADSCVLLTNKNSKSAAEEDHLNILTALAIKKYVYNKSKESKDDTKYNIKICMQLIKPESKILYYKSLNLPSTNDQLIIVEEIKMNLLAKSCFAPGLISCISNLFASAGDIKTDEFQEEWSKEYAEGMGHEVYRVILSEQDFQGPLTFKKVADLGFTEFSAIIFALEIEVKSFQDEQVARQVQKLDMPDEKYEKYFDRVRYDKVKTVTTKGDQSQKDQLMASQAFTLLNKSGKRMATLDAEDEMRAGLVTAANFNTHREKEELLGSDKNMLQIKPKNSQNVGDLKPRKDSLTMTPLFVDPIEKDYDLLSKPQSQTEVQIKDSNIKLRNHIVVCGIHSSIYHFILPLRAKYLKNYQQDIVIITPNSSIKGEIWDSISRFRRIYLIEGSPLSTEVLKQAYIHKADKAVILGHDPTIKTQKNHSELNDEMIDAQSIFIYKAIKRINPTLQILTELSYSSNIDFLLPKSKKNQEYTLSTLYAAGEVYIAATIDTITAQAFYNPHVVTILQQILVGRGEKSVKDDNEAEILANFDDKLSQSNLWQIMIPEEFINKTYDKLFKYLLLEKSLIAIGLYRLPGANDNQYPYCYTNPDQKKTTITSKDRVFVLGKEIPKDLIHDVNSQHQSVGGDYYDGKDKKKMRLMEDQLLMSDKKIQQQLIAAQGNKYKDYYGLKIDKFSNQTPKNNQANNLNDSKREGSQNNSLLNIKKQKDDDQKLSQNTKIDHQIGSQSKNKSQNAFTQKDPSQLNMFDQENNSAFSHPTEFMSAALDKLEQKLQIVEQKVVKAKDILQKQDENIKSDIIQIRKEIIIDESMTNN
eukprot:403331035